MYIMSYNIYCICFFYIFMSLYIEHVDEFDICTALRQQRQRPKGWFVWVAFDGPFTSLGYLQYMHRSSRYLHE